MTTNRATEETLRQAFKYFNRFMLLLWRLGLGKWLNSWPEVGGRIMVLTHTGRRSGQRRHTPVNYAEVRGEVYCTAGFGYTSDWYRNITTNPEVEIWLPDGWWAGRAVDITGSPDSLHILREVLIASGFASRVAGIDPLSMSDEELRQATKNYFLIHVERRRERTGVGGPGDLAWIWPLAVLILLPLVLRRGKKRA